MNYKHLIESLSNIEAVAFGYRVNGKVCGMDCSDFEQIIVDAVDAITDLLTHIEAAESRAEKAESECDRLREATKPNCLLCESMHNNGNCMEVGGFCTAVPAAHCPLIPKLLKKIREAESRAEKAESERDIAVEQLHHCENNCDYCRNRCECDKETCFSPSPITGEPTDYWKWCGLEE